MILQLKNIRGGYTKDREILQGINLDISRGETVGIIGLNGSGKSTLGKSIMNMLPYRKGEIYFNGINVSEKNSRELSKLGIAFFMQGGKVFDELSVWDNLLLCADKKEEIEEIKKYFILLSATEKTLKKIRADKLSGGERHQLALAMCLLKKPSFLILDEPSAGLSPKAVNAMYLTLDLLRKEKDLTILLIEQNIAEAVTFCCSVNLIREGLIKETITSQNLKEIEKLIFI